MISLPFPNSLRPQFLLLLPYTRMPKNWQLKGIACAMIVALLDFLTMILLVPTIQSFTGQNPTFPAFLFKSLGIFAWLNEHINDPQTTLALLLIAAVALSSLTREIWLLFARLNVRKAAYAAESELRNRMWANYLASDRSLFDRFGLGSLYTTLNEGTREFGRSIIVFYETLVGVCSGISYLAFLFFLSWKYTLVLGMLVPIFIVLMKKISKKSVECNNQRIYCYQAVSGYLSSSLQALTLIKNSNTEKKEEGKFRKLQSEFEKSTLKNVWYEQIGGPLNDAFSILFLSMFVAVCLFTGRKEFLPLFGAYLFIFRRLTNTLQQFQHYRLAITESHLRLAEILSSEPSRNNPRAKIRIDQIGEGIRFKNCSFAYQGREKVLKGVSVLIPKGQTTLLMGPSGSGKTTLLSLILKHYSCQDGTLFIGGQDINEIDAASLLQKISVVSQEVVLLNETLLENLTYGMDQSIKKQEIDRVLNLCALGDLLSTLPQRENTILGERGAKLSPGQRQRLSLARAILQNREIILMDEPTSHLDSDAEKVVHQVIREHLKERTVLIVGHRHSSLDLADKVIHLENGQIQNRNTKVRSPAVEAPARSM